MVQGTMCCVCVLANWKHNVLYAGVANNLQRRLYEHKHELIEGFTKRYHVRTLVYYEETTDVKAASEREKEVKGWRRERKNALVDNVNPGWKDLSEGWG